MATKKQALVATSYRIRASTKKRLAVMALKTGMKKERLVDDLLNEAMDWRHEASELEAKS